MIYFTSDHHFSHQNIIRYCERPFRDIQEMNETMVRVWNETVGPDDTVYYLGDFSLSRQSVRDYAPRLNGQIHLIMGNHDQCHPSNGRKAEKRIQEYLDAGFKSIKLEDRIQVGDHTVVMHHMPYVTTDPPSGYDLRFLEYRPKNEGLWLLHGHVHRVWRIKDKMINVGVDVWDFRPVSIDRIGELIAASS